MILNVHQAVAVYEAMIAVNKVGGIVYCSLFENSIRVFETVDGYVKVVARNDKDVEVQEVYIDQHDFFLTYGL